LESKRRKKKLEIKNNEGFKKRIYKIVFDFSFRSVRRLYIFAVIDLERDWK